MEFGFQVDDDPLPSSTNAAAGKREAAYNVEEENEVEVPSSMQSATTAANSGIFNQPKDEDIDANRECISSEYEKVARDDDSSRHLESPLESPETRITSQGTRSTIVLLDNLSLSTTEEDVKIFFKNVGEIAQVHFDIKDDHFAGHGHVEFTTAEAAHEALKLNNELLLDHPVRLDLVTEQAEQTSLSSVPKTLFLGNLSFSVEEDDVRGFFKDVGEIAKLHFAIRDDRFLGWARVEFTTAEAAQKALKLNNEVIHDRRVKIELVRQRSGAYTRVSSRMDNLSQRGGETQIKSVYIRGFRSSDGYDNIRIALTEHFEKCGEITRLAIPKDLNSGAPKGVAFIDFAGNYAFRKALQLNGSECGGSKLVVEEAKSRPRESGSASGWSRGYGSGRDNSGCRIESSSGRESGYGSDWRSSGRSGYGNISWHSERGYGGSWRGTSGSWESRPSSGGFGRGTSGSWESRPSSGGFGRGTSGSWESRPSSSGFGRGTSGSWESRPSSGGFGGSWGRANAFGYVAMRGTSLGFSAGWGRGNGSSGGRGVGSGYSGRGFSSSHVGRFSNSRGRAPHGS